MFGRGALVGLPAGYLGDKLSQKWVLIVALLAGCVVGYLICNDPTSFGAQLVLSFGEGAIGSGFLFAELVGGISWGAVGLIQLTLLPLVGVAVMAFVQTQRRSNATVAPGH